MCFGHIDKSPNRMFAWEILPKENLKDINKIKKPTFSTTPHARKGCMISKLQHQWRGPGKRGGGGWERQREGEKEREKGEKKERGGKDRDWKGGGGSGLSLSQIPRGTYIEG